MVLIAAAGCLVAVGVAFAVRARRDDARLRWLAVIRADAVAQVGDRRWPDVLLVMPALNEAETLRGFLPERPREIGGRPVAVLVVDDGSTDGTADVAREAGAWVVRMEQNVGGGAALQAGFAAAQALGAEVCVTLDADGQHRYADLPGLVAPILAGEADVVVGSRRLGRSEGEDRLRGAGLDLFNTVLSVLLRRRVTDCSSGMRAFRVAALVRLRQVQLRHHTAELLIEAARRGLRVREVPITIVPRRHGTSRKGHNLLYGARFALTILSSVLRR